MRFRLPFTAPSMHIAAGVVLASALGPSLLGAVPLGAVESDAVAAPPGLSIRIDDGATEIGPTQELVYTSELRNAGAAAVEATVVVAVPDYLEITSVDGSDVEGTVDGGTASWPVSVGPGETMTFMTTAFVGTIPAEERRVTTLASVYLGTPHTDDGGAPLIRSADSDRIFGIDDAGVHSDADGARPSGIPASTILFVSVGGFCVLLGASAFLLVAHRRSRSSRQ